MSEIPGDLKFLKTHEWARVEGDGKVTVGISDHAQGLLGDLVYVADPAAIKEVFTGDNAILHAGEANDILKPVMGPSSVLLTDDAEHLRSRKLMLPMFHGDAVRRSAEVVEETSTEGAAAEAGDKAEKADKD